MLNGLTDFLTLVVKVGVSTLQGSAALEFLDPKHVITTLDWSSGLRSDHLGGISAKTDETVVKVTGALRTVIEKAFLSLVEECCDGLVGLAEWCSKLCENKDAKVPHLPPRLASPKFPPHPYLLLQPAVSHLFRLPSFPLTPDENAMNGYGPGGIGRDPGRARGACGEGWHGKSYDAWRGGRVGGCVGRVEEVMDGHVVACLGWVGLGWGGSGCSSG